MAIDPAKAESFPLMRPDHAIIPTRRDPLCRAR